MMVYASSRRSIGGADDHFVVGLCSFFLAFGASRLRPINEQRKKSDYQRTDTKPFPRLLIRLFRPVAEHEFLQGFLIIEAVVHLEVSSDETCAILPFAQIRHDRIPNNL